MWSGILLTCFLPWVFLLCQNFTLRWGLISACSDIWANKQAKCLHLDQGSWDTSWYIADICLIYCRVGRSQCLTHESPCTWAVKSPPLGGRDVLVTERFCLPSTGRRWGVHEPVRHTCLCKYRLMDVKVRGSPRSKSWGWKRAQNQPFVPWSLI